MVLPQTKYLSDHGHEFKVYTPWSIKFDQQILMFLNGFRQVGTVEYDDIPLVNIRIIAVQ